MYKRQVNKLIDKQFWQTPTHKAPTELAAKKINSKSTSGLYFDVDISQLEQQLLNHESGIVTLPLPNGHYASFKLAVSQVMHPELAAKYPSIKTFSGYQVNHPENTGQFDITPHGFHGVFNIADEKVFIEPLSKDSNSRYHNYYRKDALPIEHSALITRLAPIKRATDDNRYVQKNSAEPNADIINNSVTYNLAIATTGEYSTYHGGTKESTLAALTTLVSRLNDVYQRELSIKFQLVANNDSIIFLDSETDPYENTEDDIDVNTGIINNAIGENNYDIGHLVGTGGGGLAGLGVVCSQYKGDGITGSDSPTGDAFYIDYVAHEIGHQFGADHTFNATQEACDGNREPASAYEPGSGSTIMSYAGICGEQNTQSNSDPYFHIHSIDQIKAYTSTAICGATTVLTLSLIHI